MRRKIMKTLTAILFLLSTFVFQQDVEAQTRGPRYNPNPNRGSSPTRTTPERRNPSPTRTSGRNTQTGGSNSGGYTERGPRYNPNPNRSGQTTTRRTYQGPVRTNYGTRNYHRPYGSTPVRYSHYYHVPYRAGYSHTTRYYNSNAWYNYVFRMNHNYIYASWIFYPATGYNNGYSTIDNYPYYVYNGYRNRYSANDSCNYQLVDNYDHRVVQTYWNQACNTGYDACSYERDRLNSQNNEFRFFCSETWRDGGFDYSRPSYDDSSYGNNTCVDANRDGMCDDFNGQNNTCSDNNNDGYCDN
jgi:hypothetical protein